MNNYEGEWAQGRIALVLIILIAIAFSVYYLFFQPDGIGPVNECDPFPRVLGDFVCENMKIDDSCHDVCPWTRRYQGANLRQQHDDIYNVQYYKGDKRGELTFVLAKFQLLEDAEMCYEELFNITKMCYEELFNITETHHETFFDEELPREVLLSFCMEHYDVQRFSEIYLDNSNGFFVETSRANFNGSVSTLRVLTLIDGNNVIMLGNEGYPKGDLLDIDRLKELIIEFKEHGERLR